MFVWHRAIGNLGWGTLTSSSTPQLQAADLKSDFCRLVLQVIFKIGCGRCDSMILRNKSVIVSELKGYLDQWAYKASLCSHTASPLDIWNLKQSLPARWKGSAFHYQPFAFQMNPSTAQLRIRASRRKSHRELSQAIHYQYRMSFPWQTKVWYRWWASWKTMTALGVQREREKKKTRAKITTYNHLPAVSVNNEWSLLKSLPLAPRRLQKSNAVCCVPFWRNAALLSATRGLWHLLT